MNRPIFVTGHRNPDSDSICGSLAYANLLQLEGYNAISCRLGPLNEESKFITKYFNIEGPLLIKDARSQLRDIIIDKPNLVNMNFSVKQAWDLLLTAKNRSLLVVDDNEKLLGIVSTSNLSIIRTLSEDKQAELLKHASYQNYLDTLDGQQVYLDNNFYTSGYTYILNKNEYSYISDLKDSICITSSSNSTLKLAIESQVKLLIVCNGISVDDEVVSFAKSKGCSIISCKSDPMKVAKYINESYPIKITMSKELTIFYDIEYVSDISKKIVNSRFRSYPVLNEDNRIVGQVSRYHIQSYNKRQFVLIDHSAINQSVPYIEEAEILEIIDHHHIGDIQTDYPINFRNLKCGCSCTIITLLYKEKGYIPNAQYSGILLSAIISDTLNFKSKTTTDLDIKIAKELADIANIDINSFALELLSASADIKEADPKIILNRDLKSYQFDKYKVAIGQTNYKDVDDINSIQDSFIELMKSEQVKNDYDLIIMMFTHVNASGTFFIYVGQLVYIMEELLDKIFNDYSGYDKNIISRKQQLIPKMGDILKRL